MGRVAQLSELSIHFDSADPFMPRCVYFIESIIYGTRIYVCVRIYICLEEGDARGGLLLAGIEHDNLSKNI